MEGGCILTSGWHHPCVRRHGMCGEQDFLPADVDRPDADGQLHLPFQSAISAPHQASPPGWNGQSLTESGHQWAKYQKLTICNYSNSHTFSIMPWKKEVFFFVFSQPSCFPKLGGLRHLETRQLPRRFVGCPHVLAEAVQGQWPRYDS